MVAGERAYRALLIVYPKDFREEYAGLMTQAFRDQVRFGGIGAGVGGRLWFWLQILVDLLRSGASVRKGTRMTRSRFIRGSASAAMAAGLLIALGTVWSVAVVATVDSAWNRYFGIRYAIAGWFIVAALLVVVSLAGIFLRFRGRMGIVGKVAALLIVAGLPFTVFYGVGLLLVVPGLVLMIVGGLVTKTLPYQPLLVVGLAAVLSFVVAAQGSPESPIWALPFGLGVGIAWYWLGRIVARQDEAATA